VKTVLAAVFLLLSVACVERSGVYRASGTVRNMWCGEYLVGPICHVNFEHDNGVLQELGFIGIPPFWTGLHCTIEYRDEDNGLSYLIRVKR